MHVQHKKASILNYTVHIQSNRTVKNLAKGECNLISLNEK